MRVRLSLFWYCLFCFTGLATGCGDSNLVLLSQNLGGPAAATPALQVRFFSPRPRAGVLNQVNTVLPPGVGSVQLSLCDATGQPVGLQGANWDLEVDGEEVSVVIATQGGDPIFTVPPGALNAEEVLFGLNRLPDGASQVKLSYFAGPPDNPGPAIALSNTPIEEGPGGFATITNPPFIATPPNGVLASLEIRGPTEKGAGNPVQLQAFGIFNLPGGGTVEVDLSAVVQWSSANPNVLAVSPTGLATPSDSLLEGSEQVVNVSARFLTFSDIHPCTVRGPRRPPPNFTLTLEPLEVCLGEQVNFQVFQNPGGGEVTNDPTLQISVEPNGTLSPINPPTQFRADALGSVEVTVSVENATGSARFEDTATVIVVACPEERPQVAQAGDYNVNDTPATVGLDKNGLTNHVAIDQNGDTHVVWRAQGEGLRHRVLRSDGTFAGPSTLVRPEAGDNISDACIAIDNDGTIHIVNYLLSQIPTVVEYTRSTDGGDSFQPLAPIIDPALAASGSLSIACTQGSVLVCDGRGNLVVSNDSGATFGAVKPDILGLGFAPNDIEVIGNPASDTVCVVGVSGNDLIQVVSLDGGDSFGPPSTNSGAWPGADLALFLGAGAENLLLVTSNAVNGSENQLYSLAKGGPPQLLQNLVTAGDCDRTVAANDQFAFVGERTALPQMQQIRVFDTDMNPVSTTQIHPSGGSRAEIAARPGVDGAVFLDRFAGTLRLSTFFP